MATDDERREAARRLRGAKFSRHSWERCLYDALEVDTETAGSDMLDRLADLIEPSEPKTKCVAEVKIDGEQLEKLANEAVAKVTGIDRDALLALADELEQEPGPVCGVCMGKTARRIREALGVSE